MSQEQPAPTQFTPRFRTDVYPFIAPSKFRGSLQDQVALITGAAGAIGQALAESFAVAGAKLLLTYNRTPPPPELQERCLRFGAAGVEFVQCDVSQLEGCEAVVKRALELYGKVDILVNNAGANSLQPMWEQDPQAFIHELAVNLHGPYYLMRLLLPRFRAQRSGCVLNIASRAGTVAIPYSTGYCASKAALINLTACTQKELDVEGLDDVHLYALHPGGIKSAMTVQKYSPSSLSHIPASKSARYAHAFETYYNDAPHLSGMVCVALAAGVAKTVLRGRYLDVGQDLEDVLAQADALCADPDLNALHTRFLGGFTNDGLPPGGYEVEGERFEFPGF